MSDSKDSNVTTTILMDPAYKRSDLFRNVEYINEIYFPVVYIFWIDF